MDFSRRRADTCQPARLRDTQARIEQKIFYSAGFLIRFFLHSQAKDGNQHEARHPLRGAGAVWSSSRSAAWVLRSIRLIKRFSSNGSIYFRNRNR